MTDAERRHGIVRENSLAFAMQTAELGEDAMAILARAQLYEEYQLPDLTNGSADVRVEAGKRVRDFEKFPRDPLGCSDVTLFQRCLAALRFV